MQRDLGEEKRKNDEKLKEKGQKDSPSIIHSMARLVIENYNLLKLRWNVAESLEAKKESTFE